MERIRASCPFVALKVEGSILPPEFLQTVAALDAFGQTGIDYGLSKSLVIKEELSRFWRIANDLYKPYRSRQRQDPPATQLGLEGWLVPFLHEIFGYDDLTVVDRVVLDDREFNLTHRACGGTVPMLLVAHEVDLDKATPRFGYNGRRQAPHDMMQEYLNAEDGVLWGVISNGSKLRFLRDNPSLTRPSYIEADLDLLFAEQLYADFTTLWLAVHSSRLKPIDNEPSKCIIESWRAEAHEIGERVREKLRDGVTSALRQIGNGFLKHPDNAELREALERGALSPSRYFQQLLRLIYRLLFLFTAEERDLLHTPEATDECRTVFTEGYALSRLRERAHRRRHYDQNSDLWQGLQVTFQMFAQGTPSLGLPALGGLFQVDQCPDIDNALIANKTLLESICALAFFDSAKGLTRVNYRDMDTEELGSIYESLLELGPIVDASTWTFDFVESSGTKAKGSERKLTGSYYTPPVLVRELVKSTLDPVIADALSSYPEDPRTAILSLKIIDPACGSGHFLLAAARRLAAVIVNAESNVDVSDDAMRQGTLREVVQHCIYGVDRNPLAVELCRSALWIETIKPGKPLTFLDSHIVQGDSLVGIFDPEIMANGIPPDAYESLTGDDEAICRDLKKRNKETTQKDIFDPDTSKGSVKVVDFNAMPEETLNDVERKRVIWREVQSEETHTREILRSNLFVGAYFAAKTRETGDVVPHTRDLNLLDDEIPQRGGVEEFVGKLAGKHDFLHWHLSFAGIMQNGGFDVVIGNPPWGRVKLQERKFFESRSPEIAGAANANTRARLIQKLNQANATLAERNLYKNFNVAKRKAEATSKYVRKSGRFPLTGKGDVNTYAVFAEMFLQLVKPRGRAGMIVPTGIATDHSTKKFFEHIVTERRLVSLFDFENRARVFPGVHPSYKFCLLTLNGADKQVSNPEFAFFLHHVEQLKEPARRFTLSAEDFLLFNPNTRTCPVFRTRRDMEVARKMYRRAGVFWREASGSQPEKNPWSVSFQRMFDMSNDSGLFKTRKEMEEDDWELNGNIFVRGDKCYLPLYEAKLFHQYDHRFATFDGVSEENVRKGDARDMTMAEKADPVTVVIPRYWVSEEQVTERLDMREKGLIRSLAEQESKRAREQESKRAREQESKRAREQESKRAREQESKRAREQESKRAREQESKRAREQESKRAREQESKRAREQESLLCSQGIGSQLALRKITGATNERTGLFSMIPIFGLGDSGAVIIVGSSYFGILPDQRTKEPRFCHSCGERQ